MRTTLVLDDHLLQQAKTEAARRGTTLSEIVNQALRASFARPNVEVPSFAMPVSGDPDKPVDHRPGDFWAEQESADRALIDP